MKLFSPLYTRAMRWARHPRAPWYLGGLSFAESSFFPIPPDVMLAPMSMAQPRCESDFIFFGYDARTNGLGCLNIVHDDGLQDSPIAFG